MRYWWVNQNQTYRHEIGGGYLWSPKRKSNGHRNAFYEFMREISPGDLVFSFRKTRISDYGIASSFAYESPKPAEFGAAGRQWSQVGWRVDVSFQKLARAFRPADFIELLRPLLPARYAPLDARGRGSQTVYLTELNEPLALQLADLAGDDVGLLARNELVQEVAGPTERSETELWEQHIRREIESDASLPRTDREALVLARRGQGVFKRRVLELEKRCRVTGVDRVDHLRASHCKPWRDADHKERLDGCNGLMLTPTIDHLFDRGFISFTDQGKLLRSPVAHPASLHRMGVPGEAADSGPAFTQEQARYLEYHRDAVFLQARVNRGGE